jgi:hypothetical protein
VILAGTVVDTKGAPMSGTTVRVEWTGFDFSGVTHGRRAHDLRSLPSGLEAITDEHGAYAFCRVPSQVPLSLRVLRAGDPQPPAPVVLTIPDEEVGAVRVLRVPAVGPTIDANN